MNVETHTKLERIHVKSEVFTVIKFNYFRTAASIRIKIQRLHHPEGLSFCLSEGRSRITRHSRGETKKTQKTRDIS